MVVSRGSSPDIGNWLTPVRIPRVPSKKILRLYADDFIITGTSQVLLKDEVQPLVEHFLRERGLELSHEKTRITYYVGTQVAH